MIFTGWGQSFEFPSVLWQCCFDDGKSIRRVKLCNTYHQLFTSGTVAQTKARGNGQLRSLEKRSLKQVYSLTD